eukprot:9478477-Pyramimonas_sp.AAC.1
MSQPPCPPRDGSFADRSPPRHGEVARSSLSLRGASLRWPPQQPSNAATGSQIAARREEGETEDEVGGGISRDRSALFKTRTQRRRVGGQKQGT